MSLNVAAQGKFKRTEGEEEENQKEQRNSKTL